MRILIVKPNPLQEAELIEYFLAQSFLVEIVYNRLELSRILDKSVIDIVLYNADGMDDFAQISYINHYWPQIKVIVSMENSLCSAIEKIRSGDFLTLRRPFSLTDLRLCCNFKSSGEALNDRAK